MTDAPKLKPCWSCGSPAALQRAIPLYDDAFVACSRCDTEGERCNTEAEAIAAWNTRADLIDKEQDQ